MGIRKPERGKNASLDFSADFPNRLRWKIVTEEVHGAGEMRGYLRGKEINRRNRPAQIAALVVRTVMGG